ncbi:hypothetical protein BDV93DRAFT_494048 [Ceratobasidium sp. AG-I]|nr:hypothetical protein BDV93DRAFT_494048 [Ceratobasidium sp. AG-I]
MTQSGAPSNNQMLPKRHAKFYFEDRLVAIQVEDTLFNVHKSQLLKSETFSDMFSLSDKGAKDPATTEGSESHPIKLSGVSASDFENLLTVLYAYHFSEDKPPSEATLLVPALRLANMWNFSALRAYLIPLTAAVLNDVDKIVYAREFGVSEWLGPAHIALCQRPNPPDIEESNKLGLQSLMVIYNLREKSRSNPLPYSQGHSF